MKTLMMIETGGNRMCSYTEVTGLAGLECSHCIILLEPVMTAAEIMPLSIRSGAELLY